ncbi:MAG TPA: hypothetical protein ENF95_00120 [Candidatus Aenigmarchaeota archaeon]|nr:hypothetical protein [Candidatus Aenigmarchaeota archaeon]
MAPIPGTERTFKIKGSVGFPTVVYLKLLSLLKDKYHYEIKKYKDWLEVNPLSTRYQDIISRKQVIEQSVGRILSNISEMRKDIELIKHDLRKFEQVLNHFKENKLDALKSDFVDFVDRETPNSMLKLASSGRFPTLVIDFFKIQKEEDIDKLNVSNSEKSLLKTKWMLFQEWLQMYSKAVEERVKMLKEELTNRQMAIENYKKTVEPYLKAIHKIKVTAPSSEDYVGLDDPTMVESYDTVVAGVELWCWKPVSVETAYTYIKEKYSFYSFLDIKIKKKTIVLKNSAKEQLEIKMAAYLKTGKDIEELKKKLREKEELLWKEIKEFKGEFEEEKKEEVKGLRVIEKVKKKIKNVVGVGEKEEKKPATFEALEKAVRSIIGAPIEGEFFLPKGMKGKLEKKIYNEFISLYDDIKDLFGGLKFKRHWYE